MADKLGQLEKLKKEYGFKLKPGCKKHQVYVSAQLGGRIWVTATSPSDCRWAGNAVTALRKVIDAPPRAGYSELAAIEQYEREEAIRIVSEAKASQGIRNTIGGGGKKSSSGGSGFKYYGENDLLPKKKKAKEIPVRPDIAAQLERERIAKLEEQEREAKRLERLARFQKEKELEAIRQAQWEADKPAREAREAAASFQVAINEAVARNDKFLISEYRNTLTEAYAHSFSSYRDIYIRNNHDELIRTEMSSPTSTIDLTEQCVDFSDTPDEATPSTFDYAKKAQIFIAQGAYLMEKQGWFKTKAGYFDELKRYSIEAMEHRLPITRRGIKILTSHALPLFASSPVPPDFDKLKDFMNDKLPCEMNDEFAADATEEWLTWAQDRDAAIKADFPGMPVTPSLWIDFFKVDDRLTEIKQIVETMPETLAKEAGGKEKITLESVKALFAQFGLEYGKEARELAAKYPNYTNWRCETLATCCNGKKHVYSTNGLLLWVTPVEDRVCPVCADKAAAKAAKAHRKALKTAYRKSQKPQTLHFVTLAA